MTIASNISTSPSTEQDGHGNEANQPSECIALRCVPGAPSTPPFDPTGHLHLRSIDRRRPKWPAFYKERTSVARWCQPLTIDIMFAALCFPRYSCGCHGEEGECAKDCPAIGCGMYLNSQGLTLEDQDEDEGRGRLRRAVGRLPYATLVWMDVPKPIAIARLHNPSCTPWYRGLGLRSASREEGSVQPRSGPHAAHSALDPFPPAYYLRRTRAQTLFARRLRGKDSPDRPGGVPYWA
jgi:hypothetical protein